MKLTPRMLDMLRAIDSFGAEGACEWGAVWDRLPDKSPRYLEMSNFDRTARAIADRDLISEDDKIRLTPTGHAALYGNPSTERTGS